MSQKKRKVNTKPKVIKKVAPKVLLFFHIRCHQSFIEIFITAKNSNNGEHTPYFITDCVLGEWTLYVSDSMVVQKRMILILS